MIQFYLPNLRGSCVASTYSVEDWTEACNLNDNRFVPSLCEVIPKRAVRCKNCLLVGPSAFASSQLSPYPICHVRRSPVATLSSRMAVRSEAPIRVLEARVSVYRDHVLKGNPDQPRA